MSFETKSDAPYKEYGSYTKEFTRTREFNEKLIILNQNNFIFVKYLLSLLQLLIFFYSE